MCFGNNPITGSDVLGNTTNGDYYGKDGKHLGSDGNKDDNKAYQADSKNADGTFKNAVLLSVTNSVLNQLANTVAHESSGKMEESFAIASTITNIARTESIYKGDILTTLQKAGIYGYRDGGYKTDYNNNYKHSMEAALNALMGGHDYSNGANRWDGLEQTYSLGDTRKFHYSTTKGIKKAESHAYTIGWTISSEHFQTWKQGTGRRFVAPKTKPNHLGAIHYISVAAYGRTIFWHYTEKSVSSQHPSELPFEWSENPPLPATLSPIQR
jgi:hypothetical protein